MSFISNIKDIFIKGETETKELSLGVPAIENKKGLSRKLSKSFNYRVELQMKKWRSAVEEAEDTMRPRREELYRLYHRALEDDHLLAQVRTAIFTVRSGGFIITKDNSPDDDKKELFDRPWFREYVLFNVMTEMWGHSLIEFNPNTIDGEFQNIELIPRLHVRPWIGEVALDVNDEEGINFRKGAIAKYLIELGTPNDLGLLKVASKTIIRKDYALTDWSRRNEKYGMPTLVIRTASRNKEELDEKQRMAENFGTNGWAILDDQDEIEFKESNQAFAFQTFKDLASAADKAISILINGQTGTTEEKAFVGSAEVHERILNTYTKDRMQHIQDDINFQLIPFLIRHGYALEGFTFQFEDLLDKHDNTPNPDKPDNMDKGNEQKLNLIHQKKKLIPTISTFTTPSCCNHNEELETLAFDGFDLGGIIQRSVNQVWRKKLKAGNVDADTWKYNVNALWEAAQKGVDGELIDLEYSDTRYELLTELRTNIHVFSAFKNHTQIKEMVAALTDGKKQREWKDFKVEAATIANNYNEHWLNAEYDTAVGTAQMANKWNDFQKNKDVLTHLTYITQLDERVRESHKKLHGVTLPVDDPFWDEWLPPNGWRCRCTVQQVVSFEDIHPTELPDTTETPLVFRHNAGKSKQIFPTTHPFFSAVPKSQRIKLIKATAHLIYKNYPKEWKRQGMNKQNAGFIVSHADHAGHELKDNLSIARILYKRGEAIELISNLPNKPSPDATRNGKLWEFKFIKGNVKNSIQKAINRGKKQAERILIEVKTKEFNFKDLTLGIYNGIVLHDKKQKVKELSILRNGKLIELNRKEIEDGTFRRKLKKAMK